MTEGPLDLPAPRRLTRPQKAAVIVRLLLGEGVDLSLSDLPDEVQDHLVRQMAGMRPVDQATLASVAAEFAGAVDGMGLSFPRGIPDALGALGKAISPAAAERLRRQLGPEAQGDPWPRLAARGADALLPPVQAESAEVAAVILSKLPVPLSAELLGRLPGPHARRIAHAMSRTGAVAPGLVVRIGRALLDQAEADAAPAFADGPGQRVGAILNVAPSATRDEVLEGLEAADRRFAEEVRRVLFTFADIPARVDPRDVPRIARGLENPALVAALAGGLQQGLAGAVDFLLANLSQRLAAQLREEMEGLAPMKEREAEAAMATLVARVREMEAAGELVLAARGEED